MNRENKITFKNNKVMNITLLSMLKHFLEIKITQINLSKDFLLHGIRNDTLSMNAFKLL